MKKIALFLLIGLCLLTLPIRAGIDLLHEFSGGAADGESPQGSMIISGSTLYGMTKNGGASGLGTIFKVQTNGSGFAVLHSFAGGTDDGSNPLYGSLILSGSTLYGMTYYGGVSDFGTVFKVQTNGTSFSLLHEFVGGAADGALPDGSLIISGTTLFGMTSAGGDSNYGTIFRIETNGTLFSLLHEFAGGSADGDDPFGDLLLSGSLLYGMTSQGGSGYNGTIFKIGITGTDFTLLHSFTGGMADGRSPWGSLILSGSTLYGMTSEGGDGDNGTIFRMETNGTLYSLLHEFAFLGDDGNYPTGSLVISGSTLIGMTRYGGVGGGTIFKIQVDGTDYTQLHDFAGGAANGKWPYGSLIISGSALYGMTYKGGDSDMGVIFLMPVPFTSADFIGTWDSQGVYYRNSISGAFVKLANQATLVTAGDLDGDGIDDLIGIWPSQGGVWAKYSQTGAWAQLSSTARDIACGDMNGDGRDDLVATWDGQGVYYRNSLNGAWVQMATPATQVTAGDLDGDGKADIVGIWPSQGGVWVKYSQSGSWAKLSTTAIDIACGDMNGDGRDDLVATWDGQGVYYRNSINGAWVKLATPATLVTAGDLDADGKGDVIGIWPSQGGVWVKYSQSGNWAKLSSTARHIAAGMMRSGAWGSTALLAGPRRAEAAGPGSIVFQDMATAGPGDRQFQCLEEKNLTPQDKDTQSELWRVPGPGEYGFQCQEQENLVPGAGATKKIKRKEQRQQQYP